MRLAHVERVVDEVVVDGDAAHPLLVRLAAVNDRLAEEGEPPQHLRDGMEASAGGFDSPSYARRQTADAATGARQHFPVDA